MKGAVLYEGKLLQFFSEKTAIDPDKLYEIPHSHMANESHKNRFRVEGKMPDDFHSKLVKAIRQSEVLEPKKKKKLLECIGET